MQYCKILATDMLYASNINKRLLYSSRYLNLHLMVKAGYISTTRCICLCSITSSRSRCETNYATISFAHEIKCKVGTASFVGICEHLVLRNDSLRKRGVE